MTRTLNAERRGPDTGKNLVIFVHGYGANGADLIGLADPLMPHMADTVFVAPDAPERCAGAPSGFQWFPIPWIDGSSEDAAAQGLMAASEDLNAFLDKTLQAENIAAENTILFGFSQGTMMSLHIAPRRANPVAGIAAFSGRLLHPERLASETISRPPVLLVHGNADEVVPVESLPQAADALTKDNFEVYTHIMEGTGHGIAPDGLSVALGFMKDKLCIQSK